MAQSNAPDDPETLAFEATVERGGEDIVLSETYFYPTGGGQPADRGTLGGHDVLDVRSDDGAVVHTIDGQLEAGTTVTAEIDGAFRRYCMRAHTASHVLYGAGRRCFEDLGYGGFDINPEKVRVDFRTSSEIDDDALVELERLTNRCVWDSRDVTWERLPREDALDRENVAFNTKTEEGISGETVRVVEIDGWDIAACGGTHVSNTREIGPVTVLDRSNPGEGLTRVEFAVGPTGIDRRAKEKEAVFGATERIGTNVESLAEEIGRLQSEHEELRAAHDSLRSEFLERRIDSIADDSFDRDGMQWAVGVVDADVNALAEAVQNRPDDIDVLVLTTPTGQLAVGSGPTDAETVVEELTETFGGGGGGSETVAQAGGLDADGSAIVTHLRE
jgi:alanyl-tRNA synthetase